jgi:hypothetical protein
MRQKLRNFRFRHLTGMTLVMKKNETLDPIDVRLLRSEAVVLAPNHIAYLLEQFWFVSLCRRGYDRRHERDSLFSPTKLKPD